ncbi:hypothetical protein [Shimia marina]|uniref:Uncharacterized protein n=1 Tax=Shimia marina TaxID=321267 RepID=A0A0P1F5L0_9RHOB|nr:hypothetical protein [Shimia marina]CUH50827.1 hypothetical protein SHM7688_00256 [Shimia marina]SFE54087.1 hypothetical protein SAMN04488037_11111 [Shimia marina]
MTLFERTIALVFGVFCATGLRAATIETVGEWDDRCTYYYSGDVVAGDAAKVEALNTFGAGGATLCLNSGGGNFLEGLKLFEVIWNKQMNTRVLAGHTCASACAIAWLGGSVSEGSLGVASSSRNIEPGARLGFHAPYLVLPDGGSYDDSEVEWAYRVGIRHSQGLFDIHLTQFDEARALNQYLYRQTIATPGEEMHWIDTVGEAVMSDVLVDSLVAPTSIKKANLVHLCEAAYMRHLDLSPGLTDAASRFADLRTGSYKEDQVGSYFKNDQEYWAIRLYGERRQQYVCVVSDDRIGSLLSNMKRYNAEKTYPYNGRAEVPHIHVDLRFADVWPDGPLEDVLADLSGVDPYGQSTSVKLPFYALYDAGVPLSAIAR